MGKIRILSKKAFALGPGASRDGKEVDQFITVRGAIQEIDEKYTKDLTFKMAVKDGDIVVMNDSGLIVPPYVTAAKVIDVETEVASDPVAEYKESLKLMKEAEVEAEAAKYGAVYDKDDKLSSNKKRVLEAYKISLSK